nr:EAL domain-containing protein [Aureimonas leprariae]
MAGLTPALDRQLAEWRLLLHQRQPTGRIVLVDIDARSLAEIGVWPWPRRLYGDLLHAAADAGAARVAFDIDFSARSNPADDEAFASALSTTGIETFLAAIAQADTSENDRTRVSLPIGTLLRSSWPAAVNVPLDSDGRVRRLPGNLAAEGEALAALPSLLADRMATTGYEGIDFSIAAGRIPHVSFIDLLRGRIAPEAIAGKTLIVGASAIELRDLFPVPIQGTVSGASVLALAAETLLQERELRFVTLPLWLVAFAGFAGWLVVRRLSPRHAVAAAASLALGIELAAVVLQIRRAIAVETASLHVLLMLLTAAALLRAFDLRRVLLWLAEARSHNDQTVLERVVEDGFDGVIIFDETLHVTRANSEARIILSSVVPAALRHVDDLPRGIAADVRAAVAAFRDDGATNRTMCSIGLETPGRILEYTVAPFLMTALDGDRAVGAGELVFVCLTLRDVTERERANERVRFLALHDGLTGAGNRHSLEQKFDELVGIDTVPGSALLAFDLDRFKTVNDALGHGIGDKVLVEVAVRARSVLGDSGHLARLGGDEYAMLLPATGLEDARQVGTKLVEAIERPFFVGGHRVSVGTSVGIAWWEPCAETAPSAMRRSDVALYRAKRSPTRKVVVFEPSMDADRMARLEMERDLLRAFDAGEFRLAYQPQVRLRSGEAVGAEALLRWLHPEKGFVSPAVFIPVAEEMGLIHRLGAFAMEAACREAAGWPGGLKVAVNVSALQISAGDLVQTVENALGASSLPPERLELEITESAFVDDSAGLNETFEALRQMGIRFALDDFGTGYSSLGYLHRFPISKIKIDRSFVTGVPRVGSSMAVLRSVMALAEGLAIRTIAEGIETREEAETLRILGCDDGQGYLFAKPLPADDFVSWLRAGDTETRAASA